MSDNPFKPLVLAGGKATRMGMPKHLLQMPNGETLLQHISSVLYQACGSPEKVYMSVALESQIGSMTGDVSYISEFIFDSEANTTSASAGPVAGLLAAHRTDPEATWLVAACDYPLLTDHALRYLCNSYRPPVTCFKNREGYHVPVVAIWSPIALKELAEEAAVGNRSLAAVIKKINGTAVECLPSCEDWLSDVNTKEDWEEITNVLLGGRRTESTITDLYAGSALR